MKHDVVEKYEQEISNLRRVVMVSEGKTADGATGEIKGRVVGRQANGHIAGTVNSSGTSGDIAVGTISGGVSQGRIGGKIK